MKTGRRALRLRMDELREKLKLLPDQPGVYIMLDKDGNVIYVGKARVLKNRVRQYFHSTQKAEKVEAMVSNVDDFYYIITKSAIDALSLAEQAGSVKAVNVVLIGAMAKSLGSEKEIWLKTIEKTVPPKFVEMNKRAFELGYAAEE